MKMFNHRANLIPSPLSTTYGGDFWSRQIVVSCRLAAALDRLLPRDRCPQGAAIVTPSLHRSYSADGSQAIQLGVPDFPIDCQLGDLGMSDSTNGKTTLATSRRNFIAGWKLCAGVALGLCLAERSSSAQTRGGTGGVL